MSQPNKLRETQYIGNLRVTVEAECYDGEYLDTSITSGGNSICCITFKDKIAFFDELNAIIDKYKI